MSVLGGSVRLRHVPYMSLLMVANKKKLGDFAHVLKTNGTLQGQ